MKYNKNILFYKILIIIIIILLLFFMYYLFYKKYNIESFNNINQKLSELNIQYGISGPQNMGKIIFKKPFLNNPQIFTQVITIPNTPNNIHLAPNLPIFNQAIETPGDSDNTSEKTSNIINNIYSVQIYNVKPTSFNYAKNYLSNTNMSDDNIKDVLVTNLAIDSSQQFSWIALGEIDNLCINNELEEEGYF